MSDPHIAPSAVLKQNANGKKEALEVETSLLDTKSIF